ncbi:GNAT family N-acetyltransferase [Sporosarcina sp. G11-34]|uniref:GNAT family N-acetyltransferase n=1 Tax=Sporosarcina sp. G11-34 TaxID=2849605 RepID=UPI0022A8FD6A|nr:GNAT family N-acetyltransferase [Sporosarcina sp. G11-34]MCZ2260346.1 GNAT family N-acetyltransferase [Sporosarcina sp. G11-34]
MIRFVQFEEKYIPQMAELLAARHVKERKRFPFLPEKYENPEEATNVLIEETNKPFTSGLVTLRGDEVIGYLLYEFKKNATQGRHVSVGYSSLAMKEDEHPRLVRLMYAEVGAEWIRNGYFEHVLFAPVGNDPIILELLEQSFRFDQRYAVLPLETYVAKSDGTAKVTFRQVTEDDISILEKMASWNSIHQASAPAWSPITKESLDKVRAEYEELAEDTEVKMWIAEQNGIPAAFHVYYPAESNGSLATPENTVHLAAASTNTDMRGKGIGKAIADYCFNEVEEDGYEYVMADWHTPNHLASYFWPKRGFQSYMIRMVRTVDPRISWADGVH